MVLIMVTFFEGVREQNLIKGLDFLCVDNDGPLQQMMSSRTNPGVSFDERLDSLEQIFKEELSRTPNLGVALVVEELCPGGLDATDGIAIAKRMEQAGAAFIIASGGTKDFPALKWRRETRLRYDAGYVSESWMASPLWLMGQVKIPVFAQGPFKDWEQARVLAKQLGFRGLILD